jgi:hypothetical protein
MLRSPRVRLSWLGLATLITLCFAATNAGAQPMTMVRAMGPGNTDAGPSVFLSVGGGFTPLVTTFGGSNRTQSGDLNSVVSGLNTYTYKELSQQLLNVGPQFGLRLPLGPYFVFWVSAGTSLLRLDDKSPPLVDQSAFKSSFEQIKNVKSLTLNPGFAAATGIDWDGLKFGPLTLVVGANVDVFTSSGLSGYEANGANTVTNLSTETYAEARTTNLSLALISVEPHVGLEWRPFGTLAINSFGVFGSATFSVGSLTERTTLQVSLQAKDQPKTGHIDTQDVTIALSMTPVSYVGAYYGWYFAFPHFGTIGVEGQFGARLSGVLSYQYAF